MPVSGLMAPERSGPLRAAGSIEPGKAMSLIGVHASEKAPTLPVLCDTWMKNGARYPAGRLLTSPSARDQALGVNRDFRFGEKLQAHADLVAQVLLRQAGKET